MPHPPRPRSSEERRSQSPCNAAEDPEPTAVGDPRRGEPTAEHCEGQSEDPQQHDGVRGRAGPERADDGDDTGEGVGGADDVDADVALAPSGIGPQCADGVAQRKKCAAAEGGPRQQ